MTRGRSDLSAVRRPDDRRAPPPRLVSASLPPAALDRYAATFGLPAEAAIAALARAVATSVGWAEYPGSLLIARPGRAPALLAAGRFGRSGLEWLRAQSVRLATDLDRLVWVGPERVPELVRRLARRLAERLGERLATAELVAIPRGGLRVRDALARELGRPAAPTPHASAAPVVLVDDCALTGQRLREALDRLDRPATFATLVSPPPLRAAVAATEPRLEGFVTAADLPSGDGAPVRTAGYWRGDTAPLGFPWGEPRRWVRLGERVERTWRLVPPELCTKNAAAVGRLDLRVVEAEETTGEVLTCPLGEGAVLLADLARGRTYRLDPPAAELWAEWRRGGSGRGAVEAIARRHGVARAEVAADADALLAAVRAAGLLEVGSRRPAADRRSATDDPSGAPS